MFDKLAYESDDDFLIYDDRPDDDNDFEDPKYHDELNEDCDEELDMQI